MFTNRDPRIVIAIEQLDKSIELFLKEESYICSLTLAGAAEEILGKAVRENGRESSIDESFSISAYFEKAINEIRENKYNETEFKKQYFTKANKARNELKHWVNSSDLEDNYKEHAKDMIIRAYRNCELLGIDLTDLMSSFNEWFYSHEA